MTDKPKRVRRKPLPVTPAEIISRGIAAKSEYERTEDAFLAVREELLEAIASSVPSDTAGRERLYAAIWVLGRARDMLIQQINDGAMADHAASVASITGAEALN
jgi:hypothetical protein